MRSGLRRVAVPQRGQPAARTQSFPAPVNGWVTNQSLAKPPRESALVLDNWFPTGTGIRLRGGSVEHADTGTGEPVQALFPYLKADGTTELFAASDGAVWDVTSSVDAPSSVITGQDSDDVATVQIKTAGGDYLTLVNGEDDAQLYDGTTWQALNALSTPAITGVATSALSHAWLYRNREYFVQKGTMDAWYLALDSIAGTATKVTLAGVFQRGGSLLFGATWSQDAGDGADDRCVFVSTTGEVAVYAGADPGATDWSLVGRYDISPPLGKHATMRVGGDLLICTTDGLVPLSQVYLKDAADLSLAAVSYLIEPDWKAEATRRYQMPWSIVKWPEKNMAIVGLPITEEGQPAYCFVVNVETKRWARYTGWNALSLAWADGVVYFGTADGRVMQAEIQGKDDGQPYTAKYCGQFDSLRGPGAYKITQQARAIFRGAKAIIAKLSMAVNYTTGFPAAPSAAADTGIAEWDAADWDEAVWDSDPDASVNITGWRSVTGRGVVHAPQVQITCGATATPDAELMQFDVTYQPGGTVV